VHFRDDVPVELYTDGSRQGIAGVLVQEGRMVAVASRVLKAAERNYHPVEFEMLAVANAMHVFSHYLRGRHFTLYTDHKPLLGVIRKIDVENTRLQNLKVKISEFSFTAKHVRGTENRADYWTRLFGDAPSERNEEAEQVVAFTMTASFEGCYDEGDLDTLLKMEHRRTAMGWEVKVGNKWRVFVPRESRHALCWQVHRERHEEVRRMEGKLVSYYWPRMRDTIAEFVQACRCAATKEGKPGKNKNLRPVLAEFPGDMLAMDLFAYEE